MVWKSDYFYKHLSLSNFKYERLYQSKLLNTSQSQLNSGSEGDMSKVDLITWIKVAVSSQNIWDSHLKCLHYDTNDHISLHERRLFLFFFKSLYLVKGKMVHVIFWSPYTIQHANLKVINKTWSEAYMFAQYKFFILPWICKATLSGLISLSIS